MTGEPLQINFIDKERGEIRQIRPRDGEDLARFQARFSYQLRKQRQNYGAENLIVEMVIGYGSCSYPKPSRADIHETLKWIAENWPKMGAQK